MQTSIDALIAENLAVSTKKRSVLDAYDACIRRLTTVNGDLNDDLGEMREPQKRLRQAHELDSSSVYEETGDALSKAHALLETEIDQLEKAKLVTEAKLAKDPATVSAEYNVRVLQTLKLALGKGQPIAFIYAKAHDEHDFREFLLGFDVEKMAKALFQTLDPATAAKIRAWKSTHCKIKLRYYTDSRKLRCPEYPRQFKFGGATVMTGDTEVTPVFVLGFHNRHACRVQIDNEIPNHEPRITTVREYDGPYHDEINAVFDGTLMIV